MARILIKEPAYYLKQNATRKMKLFAIVILSLCMPCLTWGQVQSINDKSLPVPSSAFLKKARDREDAQSLYFLKYFGAASKKKVSKSSLGGVEVEMWQQSYNGGITYQKYYYVESGSKGIISFPSYGKKELVKYIIWFFEEPYNKWNKAQTQYSPKEEGDAGCYINIKQDKKQQYYIEYDCGC